MCSRSCSTIGGRAGGTVRTSQSQVIYKNVTRQLEATKLPCEMAQRICAPVTVGAGVREGADAAGIEHDHEHSPRTEGRSVGPRHAPETESSVSDLLNGEKTAWSTAAKMSVGAYSSTTTSSPEPNMWIERTR